MQGDRVEATRLLRQALLRGRWSIMALHVVQRIFGTMILAAPDAQAARAVVDQAMETMGAEDSCSFCDIMLAVPAAMACADVGDVDEAQRHLAVAERSADLWEGTSWQGAILEVRAHLSLAEGDEARADALLDEAAEVVRAGWAAVGRRPVPGRPSGHPSRLGARIPSVLVSEVHVSAAGPERRPPGQPWCGS